MSERTPPTAAGRVNLDDLDDAERVVIDAICNGAPFAHNVALGKACVAALRDAGLLPLDTPRAACKLCNDTGWEHHAVNDGQMIGSTMTRCRNGCAVATTQNAVGGEASTDALIEQLHARDGDAFALKPSERPGSWCVWGAEGMNRGRSPREALLAAASQPKDA